MTRSVGAERGEQGGERGAVDPGHGAQRKLGHRHQRAGIAGRQSGVGGAVLHRVDRQPIEVVLARRIAWLGFSLASIDVGGVVDR